MTSYNDRVEGVLLATAAGDALGAPYEFKPPRGPELEVAMVGGGGWEPGEWTDDTSMAIAIAEVAATGADLRDASAQDAIVQRWYEWSRTAKDVGIQTGSVLTAAARDGVITAASARAESAKLHERTGRTAGNGSLMRTAPVALAYLDDEDAMVEAARAISELTHFDPDAGDACVLWCSAIRHAVLTGELDVRIGMRQHRVRPSRPVGEASGCRGIGARPRRSRTTGGWSRRCRRRGRRSPRPRYPSTIPTLECSAPTTLAWRWTPRSGLGTTPTRWRRSREACSVRRTALPRFRAVGATCCTAGRASPPMDWWRLRRPSSARGSRTGSTSRTRARRSTPSRGTHTTTASCSAASAYFAGCPRRSTRSSRCAGWPTRTCADGMPHVEVRLIDRPEHDENPHLDFVLLDTVRCHRAVPAGGTHRAGALRRGVQPHADRGGAVRCAAAQYQRRRRAARRHGGAPRCPPELCVPSSVAAHRVSLIRRRFN